MANKPSREEIELYKAYKKKSDYKAAANVLAPYRDNPEIDALIKKLALAHKRQSQTARQVSSQKHKEKVGNTQSKQSRNMIIFVLFLFLILACAIVTSLNQSTPQAEAVKPAITTTALSTSTPFPTPSDPLAQYLLAEISGIEYIDDMQSGNVPGRSETRYDMTVYLYDDADINSTLETLSATVAEYRTGNAPENEIFSLTVELWQGNYGETWRFTGSQWSRRSVNGVAVTPTRILSPVPNATYGGQTIGNTGNNSSSGSNNQSTSYTCNCNKTCGQMSSCQEAQFQLLQCSCTERDSDGDGLACDIDCQ